MGVPNSEVGYTSAMPRREDNAVRKGHVGSLDKKSIIIIIIIIIVFFVILCSGASDLPLFVNDATHLSAVVTLCALMTTKFPVVLNLPIIVPCRCLILIVCVVGALKTS